MIYKNKNKKPEKKTRNKEKKTQLTISTNMKQTERKELSKVLANDKCSII